MIIDWMIGICYLYHICIKGFGHACPLNLSRMSESFEVCVRREMWQWDSMPSRLAGSPIGVSDHAHLDYLHWVFDSFWILLTPREACLQHSVLNTCNIADKSPQSPIHSELGFLTSNRGGGRRTTLADRVQRTWRHCCAIVGCHCSVLWFGGRVTTNFGGVDVVPLVPL